MYQAVLPRIARSDPHDLEEYWQAVDEVQQRRRARSPLDQPAGERHRPSATGSFLLRD